MSPETQAILDAFPDLIVLVASSGLVVAANTAFAKAVGESPDRLVGAKLFDLIETPPDRAAAFLRRCSGIRQASPGTLAFRTRAGTTLACRCDGVALRPSDPADAPVVLLRCRAKPEAISRFTLLDQKIADLTREILGRQRAEEELRLLNEVLAERVEERAEEMAAAFAQLNQSEHRFRVLVEGVTDYAIYMLDPDGLVINWNSGAERIKGYTDAEIVGQHFSRFFTEEDRLRHVPDDALKTAARTGRFESEGWRVRKSGSRFWANAVLAALYDNGKLVGFAKITRDLTERRTAEERFRQAQKMEAVGQLTGGIAHDFNNLLTVIGGNVETLQRRLGGDARDLHQFIDAAMRGVERAASLTHRLLAFSRRQPLDPKPVEMNRLIIGISDLLSRTLGEHVRIATVLSGGLWRVSADSNQVENAILNLAVNARDAMPNGGTLTIETANTRLDEAYASSHDEVTAGEYVMLAVSDTGLGMTKEIMAQVFEPFFTTKKLGEGTGLGLSQVYGFMKQSGGHVKVYSEVGEGTTVRLYFPRGSMPEAATENTRQTTIIPSARHGEVILAVEDDPEVRAYTAGILRELGYEVLEAADGDSALAILATEPQIKLLFTDVGLPGALNGRHLADEALKRRPDLKVLFTTGYARNAIVHQGRLDSGVNLIVKPFTYAALAAKIRSVLETPD